MTKLSIVILNYNTADLTINCINSIKEQYNKELENGDFQIVLVDNNSLDDSLEKLKIWDLPKGATWGQKSPAESLFFF
jgi:GT2 family glycosyltransferase